ncbi:fungal-specific transcription factor domain-containing protein [Exophiala viscosa]|uniref:fungal-specific transcription factor domain-containing protein n=1 Tax=Exophiala viscosa TaxID=2486360 RepID=UPI0021994EAE|nr:fungal-specific transcription factor domain-containing protein [Exophiala viscosa]
MGCPRSLHKEHLLHAGPVVDATYAVATPSRRARSATTSALSGSTKRLGPIFRGSGASTVATPPGRGILAEHRNKSIISSSNANYGNAESIDDSIEATSEEERDREHYGLSVTPSECPSSEARDFCNLSSTSASVSEYDDLVHASGSAELDLLPSPTSQADLNLEGRPRPERCRSSHGRGARNSRTAKSSTWLVNLLHEPSSMLAQTHDESRLFHHYTSYLSTQMVPIDSAHNPWRSTYPVIAAHQALSSNQRSRSLYHAIIAMSGLHLANLKGSEHGTYEVMTATRYYGMALRSVRESLSEPTASDYNCVLAALIVMTLAEHAFEAAGSSRGWRTHLAGGLRFIMHHLAQDRNPWARGHDAWVMTQTLAMFAIIAQTTSNHSRTSTGSLSEISHVLHDAMAHPRFGYTVGGNARLLNAIYQVRYLEEQITMARAVQDAAADAPIRREAEKIMRELHLSACDDDVDTYLSGTDTSSKMRGQVKMHLDLFAASIRIYCQRNVLHAPPSAVVDYVHQVLTLANALMDADCGAVFIWPVMVAAVEAYTPESQALARRFFDRAEKRGGANRKAMHRVIRQVWTDRERLASECCCDSGDVAIDWREVMESLGVDILLL